MENKIKIICNNCSKLFYVYKSRANAKYCSKICANKSFMGEQEKRICLECNKEYIVNKNLKRRKKFCSDECRKINMKNRNIIKFCEFCGKEFKTNKKRQNKFCSKDCYLKSNKKRKIDNIIYNECITDLEYLKKVLPKDKLYDLYINKKMKMNEIAEKYSISKFSMKNYIQSFNFNKRHPNGKIAKFICKNCKEELKVIISKKRDFCSMKCYFEYSKGKIKKFLPKEDIVNILFNQELPLKAVKEKYKTDYETINKNLKYYNLYDKYKEFRKDKKFFTYINGSKKDYYSKKFNGKYFRQIIRNYYGNKCFICWFESKSRKLDVHHIDYNKKNDNFYNLIPLCQSCHSKTNYNREYWQQALSSLVILRNLGYINRYKGIE